MRCTLLRLTRMLFGAGARYLGCFCFVLVADRSGATRRRPSPQAAVRTATSLSEPDLPASAATAAAAIIPAAAIVPAWGAKSAAAQAETSSDDGGGVHVNELE